MDLSGVRMLTPDQLVELSPREIAEMSTKEILQLAHSLGFNVASLRTKSQVLTKLGESAIDVSFADGDADDGEDEESKDSDDEDE